MDLLPLRIALWVLITLALQLAVVPVLAPEARPDLLRVFTVLAGFFAGERAGVAAGVAAGLPADLLAGRLLGLRALLCATAGWAGGRAGRHLFRDNPVLAVLLVGAVIAAQDAATFVALRLMGLRLPLARALSGSVVPGLAADLLAAVPMYVLMARSLQPRPPLTGNIHSLPPAVLRARARRRWQARGG